jgi:hypothetical protein
MALVYLAVAWIVLVQATLSARDRGEVVAGVVEAALWPAIVLLANVGVAVDAARAWRAR